MALTNLSTEASCAHRQTRRRVKVELLASTQDTEASRYAGMALANLACNRQNRAAVVTLNGLRPLNVFLKKSGNS